MKAGRGGGVKRGDVCYGMLRAAACVDEPDTTRFSTFWRVYHCPGLFHGQIRSHGPQWQPPGLDQPLCRVKR